MITSLKIGHAYHLVGIGTWSSWSQDVIVGAIIDPSQIDLLGIDIYSTWFSAYNVDESIYTDLLDTMTEILHCKILKSRNPAVSSNNGEDLYTFDEMIDFNNSEELIDCKSYSWMITTKPYTDDDENCPVNMTQDIADKISDAVKDVIYDSTTMYKLYNEFYVAQSEYDTFVSIRTAGKLSYTSDLLAKETAYNTAMTTMQEATTAANLATTNYSAKNTELDTKIAEVQTLKTTLNASISNYTAAEATLEAKYNSIYTIVNEYNNKSTTSSADKITLPSWSELGT